ncbi:hypothetical protein C8R46DRAFT_1030445 [Mycena filopes]|nr:hypothetical protein C8R46DRAFT_1030445 [Mycena filopes]
MTVFKRANDIPEPLDHPTIYREQLSCDVAAPVEDPVDTADSSEPKDGTDSDAGGGVIDEHKQESGPALPVNNTNPAASDHVTTPVDSENLTLHEHAIRLLYL